jgi:hypothetical protein
MLEIINNKLFIHICKHPHSTTHLRQLARTLRISPPTCGILIQKLKKEGLITVKRVGRNLMVTPKIDDRFMFHKRWANVLMLLDSGLVEKISGKSPTSFILFGSYCFGMDHEKSDIDIALDIDYKEDLTEYEKKLGRSIQLHRIGKDTPPNLRVNIRQGLLIHGVMI